MIKTHDYTSKSYSSFSQLCSFCKCKNPLTVKPSFQLKKKKKPHEPELYNCPNEYLRLRLIHK